ncbi:MAG: hypothetical protein HC926_06165 [Synechococcaceae cyanobacterium SM2_3_60]|nr:hypothetical protein [Synechococcaceae cyanobacterium SM2_3_60]
MSHPVGLRSSKKLPIRMVSSFFLPIFSQRSFEGYILGVFRVADVVTEAIATLQTDLSFHLYDDSALPAEAYLGTYDAHSGSVIVDPQSILPFLESFLPPRLQSTL